MLATDREADLLAWAPPDSEVVVGIDLKDRENLAQTPRGDARLVERVKVALIQAL